MAHLDHAGADKLASWENVAGARSMTRPGLCASRSSTVQRIAAPVETSVTVTTVPNANVGLAHVPAGAPYHDACPVVVFCGGGSVVGTGVGAGATGLGAGGAVVVVTGFTTGAGTGGGAGVVVVGGTWRYDVVSTVVWAEASAVVVRRWHRRWRARSRT